MKRTVLTFLLLVHFLLLPAGNRALLVSIPNYPEESGWCTLSPVRDIEKLKSTTAPSFKASTLAYEQATYHGIIHALEELFSNAQEGDTIFIHFSSHGQQVLSNDSCEVNHLDEALIPYDAFSKETKHYKGEHHLKDDTLSRHIQRIMAKAGPLGFVIITLDSCHSDSMDKSPDPDSTKTIYPGGASLFGVGSISQDSSSRAPFL